MITPEKLASSGSEQGHQSALFCWAAMEQSPELKLMFHVPNGGYRNKIEAQRLQAAGVKKGVYDILLPVSRGGFHGLFIEMKSKTGVVSKEQKEFGCNVQKQGYAAVVCYDWQEARNLILSYLREGGLI
jgi:hypothetical protein